MTKRIPRRVAIVALAFGVLPASRVWAAPSTGDVPPPMLGKDLDGESVSLGNYDGKAVIVSFWATWCPYCLKELPILEGIQKSVGKAGIQVIAVNTESREVFRRAARALRLEVLMAHDTGKEVAAAYGVNGIPHMVIIGRSGRIVRVYKGYGESSLDSIVADVNLALTEKR